MRIVDAHTTLFHPEAKDVTERFPRCTYENMMRWMEWLGVDRAIIWSTRNTSHGMAVARNDWMREIVRRSEGRLIGFANLYPPERSAALGELERVAQMPEFAGVKMHPELQRFPINSPDCLAVVEKVKDKDLPLVFHVNGAAISRNPILSVEEGRELERKGRGGSFADVEKFADVAEAYDSPKLMAAHMGGIYNERVQRTRVTFQTAGASRMGIEWTVRELGADRLVFGSDWPFYEADDEISKVLAAKITEEEKEKIFHRNIEKILGM